MKGHGHVIPNADGSKARCGGPKICSVCAKELASHPKCEPCGDPNPWPLWEHGIHLNLKPCGRPQGHDSSGGGGAQWGSGHAERPNDSDPPVKEWTLISRWEAK